LGRNSGHIHVLQCSEKSITCLRARVDHSGVVVDKHITRHGDWSEADGTLQRTLVEFVETQNLSAARVVTILPRHSATVRLLELPSHDIEEIAGMVELSASDFVPYSPDEIVVSSCIIKKLPKEQSQVLAAVVHRSVLDEHLSLYQGAGLAPESIYLSTACMLAALEYPTAHGDGTVLYGHTTADSLELLALCDGEVLYTRGLETDASDSEKLCTTVEQALGGCERELPQTVSGPVYFSSGDQPCGSVIDQIRGGVNRELVENSTGLRGVKKGDGALNGIPLPEIGAVLLAQQDSPYSVDLLPHSVKDHRERNRSRRLLLQNVVTGLLTALLIAGAFGQAVYQRNVYRDELRARADELRPEASRVALKRGHLNRLQEQVTRTDTVYEHLARIISQTPTSGLNFSLFAYEYDKGITLQGRADSPAKFGSLIDQLRTVGKSVYPQFAAAQETYRHSRMERGKNVWEYSISIQFPKETGGSNE